MKKKTTDLRLSKVADFRPRDEIGRRLFDADSAVLYDRFFNYIHWSVDLLKVRDDLGRHHDMLSDFLDKFDTAFDRWKNYLDQIGTIPEYPEVLMDLLSLGLWDADYRDDAEGKRSPFGPWLVDLDRALGGSRIGVLHAFFQQIFDPHGENLEKAQELATSLYEHFLEFVDANELVNLKPDYEHPPIVQLYAGGPVTCLKDLPLPTIIAFDYAEATEITCFSALPHEFGHDVSGTFKGASLVEEIIAHIADLNLPRGAYWGSWAEECFADAIGVAILREGGIISLANLFSDYYTNIIFQDETGQGPDEHPNRHVRVLLAIEVARILGIEDALLGGLKKKWIEFGEKKNTAVPADKIYDQFNNTVYPMDEFLQSIDPVAAALVDTSYGQLAGKKVSDIFSDFRSPLAEEIIAAISPGDWYG